jgi:hypothetical protein
MTDAKLAVVAMVLTLAVASSGAGAQSSGAGIVDEALKGVRQDQERDAERVRRMVDEAVRGAENAPSGEETVSPSAPERLDQLSAGTAAGVLPAGFRVEELVGRPVEDGTGGKLGTLRAVAVEPGGDLPVALIEFAPLFGRGAKTAAVPLDELTPSATADSLVLSLTAVGYDELPAYAWRDGVWRRAS